MVRSKEQNERSSWENEQEKKRENKITRKTHTFKKLKRTRKISLTQREYLPRFTCFKNSVGNLFRLRIMCIMKLPVI